MKGGFALVLAAAILRSPQGDLDSAFERYWSASDAPVRREAARAIASLAPRFEDVLHELAEGRRYSEDAPKGRIERERLGSDGRPHPYVVLVPDDYDPSRRYAVRVFLHGGVSRGAFGKGDSWWRREERVRGDSHITVLPASWNESLWWQHSQVENLTAILGELKQIYNVDENRVYLFGVSDGATGAYFHAFRSPTLWAAVLPFIGHAAVLDNPAVQADGDLFPTNLSNRPLFVVNADGDRLYPTHRVLPYVDLFRAAGAEIVFRQKNGGHDTRWWGAEKRRFDRFLSERPRDALPDRITWETERTDRYARFSWLVIEELGETPGETADSLVDVNVLSTDGVEQGRAFSRSGASGRVDVERRGNEIVVLTRGVRRYRLLLSPARFDFAKSIRVVTNGRTSFEGTLTPSVETLLSWSAVDDDREMLFAAELSISPGARARLEERPP